MAAKVLKCSLSGQRSKCLFGPRITVRKVLHQATSILLHLVDKWFSARNRIERLKGKYANCVSKYMVHRRAASFEVLIYVS